MIDSVALAWGGVAGSAPRRGTARARLEPLSDPIRLDARALHEKWSRHGALTRKLFDGPSEFFGGHWKLGNLEILYSDGVRLEVRASVPKIVTGGANDVVLNDAQVHEGLREIVRRTSELVEHDLSLRDATPTRIDSVIQWDADVAWVCEHLKASFHPARKLRTEIVAPHGGRSLVYGYGSKRVLRFYDKGAEVAKERASEISHLIDLAELEQLHPAERRVAIRNAKARAREQAWAEAELNTILRFEVQDRRSNHLRRIHEDGYRAVDVRRELENALDGLTSVSRRDFAAILAEQPINWPHRVAYAAAPLYFVEHPDSLSVVRAHVSRRVYYEWRRRTREAALKVGDWSPTIRPDEFESGSSLWALESAA